MLLHINTKKLHTLAFSYKTGQKDLSDLTLHKKQSHTSTPTPLTTISYKGKKILSNHIHMNKKLHTGCNRRGKMFCPKVLGEVLKKVG
jgi:hypothetical protein